MIEIKNLTKNFTLKKNMTIRAINDVSIEFPNYGLIAIVGKSGSGKTTFLNILAGLEKPSSGEIIFDNPDKTTELFNFSDEQNDEYRNLTLGLVFQDYNLIEHWTVEQNLRIVLEQQNWNGKNDNQIVARIAETLRLVDLESFEKRKINELSGGQQQRVAIARALIKSPKLILADEPTGNLDSENSESIMRVLKRISQNCLVVVVTHDNYMAEKYADRLIRFVDGRIAEDKMLNESNSVSVNICANDSRECVVARSLSVEKMVRLSLSALRIKIVKLCLYVLALSIVLSIIHCGYTLYGVTCGKAVSKFLKSYNVPTFYTYKNESCIINGLEYVFKIENDEQMRSCLEEEFGIQNVFRVINNSYISADINNEVTQECSIVVGGKNLDKYTLIGEPPSQKNEVVITDVICQYLGFDESCIGRELYLNGMRMKISGISVIIPDGELYSNMSVEKELALSHHAFRVIVTEDYYDAVLGSKELYIPMAELNYSWGSDELTEKKTCIAKASSLNGENLVWGRLPEKQGEIVLGEIYANERFLPISLAEIEDWNFEFLDIYEVEDGRTFGSFINLHEHIPNVEVVGVARNFEGLILFDDDYESIAQSYFERKSADAYEILLTGGTRNKSSIYDKLESCGYIADMGPLDFVYLKCEEYKEIKWLFQIVMAVMGMLLFLLMVLFFSFNVRDNHSKIGILRALGVRMQNIFVIWVLESGWIAGLTLLFSGIIEACVVSKINIAFRVKSGLATNVIYHLLSKEVGLAFCVLLITVLAVSVPIWIMKGEKIIDLIRKPD